MSAGSLDADEGSCTVSTAERSRELSYTVTPEITPGQRLVAFGEPC